MSAIGCGGFVGSVDENRANILQLFVDGGSLVGDSICQSLEIALYRQFRLSLSLGILAFTHETKGFYFSDNCLRGYFSFGLSFKRRHPISLRSSERSIFVRQTRGVGRFFALLP
jgi:hypothetical protein